MGLKLKTDGTIEADTPAELAEYAQLIARNGHSAIARRAVTDESEDGPLPDSALKLVRLLLPLPKGMGVKDVAKEFNLEHTKGIGGPANSLAAWGKRHNMRRALLVRTKSRDEQGKTIRTWKLSEFFRKQIKDGKVPGVESDN